MGDSKAVKIALKEARERLDGGDAAGALKCCKRALTVDAQHYLANVFAGKCHDEIGNADKAKEVRTHFLSYGMSHNS